MHVILVSVGTDGDIFPYAGLGATLRSRGHRVTLVASEHYEPLATANGFGFRALVSTQENNELFGHPDFWKPLRTAPLSARWGRRFIERQYELLKSIITEDTVLVGNPGVFAVGLVHEKLGVPWTTLVLQPGIIPSSVAPPVMPAFEFLRGAPGFVWDGFWRALDLVGYVLVERDLNRIRARLGLPRSPRIFRNWLSPQLAIGLFPEWYAPAPVDWPPQLRLAGFPLADGGQKNALPEPLLEFCASGAAPVVFTFGTGMAHPGVLFRAALEACTALGLRAVFLTKFEDQLPGALPESVYHCRFASFQKLFPHCAAVVHHGGIGTVAQALASGTPQLVCPICFDQADNGERVRKMGAGDWVKTRNGARMAEALRRVMSSETKARCCEVAARFREGDALETAAGLIEEMRAPRG